MRGLIARATFLNGLSITLGRGCVYISNLILILFLDDVQLGYAAMVTAVYYFSNSISSMGLESLYISDKCAGPKLLSAIWLIDILRGMILCSLIYLNVDVISHFLNMPKITESFALISFILIIMPFKNYRLVIERKFMKFEIITLCEIATGFITLLTTYFFLSHGYGHQSVIYGMIVGQLSFVFLSYAMMHPPVIASPRFHHFKKATRFAFPVVLNGQVSSLIEYSVQFVVGKYFGAATVGVVDRVDFFVRKTFLQLTELIWKVGLPAIRLASANGKDLRNLFHVFLAVSLLSSITTTIIGVTTLFIIVDYTQVLEFNDFKPYINIFATYSILLSFYLPFSIFSHALIIPKNLLFSSLIRAVVILVLFVNPYIEKNVQNI